MARNMNRPARIMTQRLLIASAIVACSASAAEPIERVIGGKVYVVEELVYEDFVENLSNWVIEGDADIRLYDGFLDANANRQALASQVGVATMWYAREFEGPQLIEYDVRLMGDSIFGHINMFLNASMPEGKGVLETSTERGGNYSEYLSFPNYSSMIINNETHPTDKHQSLKIGFRLNPGFNQEAECWLKPLVHGQVYHFTYVLQPPELEILIDDKLACTHRYSQTLTRGFHALRLYHTHSIYDNFRISEIIE